MAAAADVTQSFQGSCGMGSPGFCPEKVYSFERVAGTASWIPLALENDQDVTVSGERERQRKHNNDFISYIYRPACFVTNLFDSLPLRVWSAPVLSAINRLTRG